MQPGVCARPLGAAAVEIAEAGGRRNNDVSAMPSDVDVIGQIAAVPDRLAVGHEEELVLAHRRGLRGQRIRQADAHLHHQRGLEQVYGPDLLLDVLAQDLARLFVDHLSHGAVGARIEVDQQQAAGAGVQPDLRARPLAPPRLDLLLVTRRLLQAARFRQRLAVGTGIADDQRTTVAVVAREDEPAPARECYRRLPHGRERR